MNFVLHLQWQTAFLNLRADDNNPNVLQRRVVALHKPTASHAKNLCFYLGKKNVEKWYMVRYDYFCFRG